MNNTKPVSMPTRRRGDKETRRNQWHSPCLLVSMPPCPISTIAAIALTLLCISRVSAGDLSIVPFFDGERNDSLDLWGGPLSAGSGATFSKESTVVHSGAAAYQMNVGSIASGDFR